MNSLGPNPSGLCQCGCGRATPIAARTDGQRGYVAGQPQRYVRGHRRRSPLDPAARLFARLRAEGECLVFTGALDGGGYGRLAMGGRWVGAHRLAWELQRGPIPAPLFVLHHCDNPSCCNVEHLFLGTQRDNMRDMAAKGRASSQRNSHKYAGEANGRSKLTEEDVAHIRATPRAYGSGVALQRAFGVSKATIQRARDGSGWRGAYEYGSADVEDAA